MVSLFINGLPSFFNFTKRPRVIKSLWAILAVLTVMGQPVSAGNNQEIQSKVKNLINFYQNSKSLSSEESILAQEFLYRLSFKIHTFSSVQDERKILLSALDNIAQDSNLNTHPRIISFSKILSKALRDHLEPKEDAFVFVKNFISYSGIAQQKSVDEFFEKQDYINKKSYLKAQTPLFEEAGQIAVLKTETQKDFLKINPVFDLQF
jgi:hypothetical protein